MPIAPMMQARPLEYFLLHNAKPTGPNMGIYAGREIPASVVDEFGRQYNYVGIAPRTWGGKLDVDALTPGEFILLPGLIYRLEGAQVKTSWLASIFQFH